MNYYNNLILKVGNGMMPTINALTDMPFGVAQKRFRFKGYRDEIMSARLIEPMNARKDLPALIYLHGGGFCFEASPAHLKNVALYAKFANCRVIMPDYHLLPEHAFPAALTDAICCYQFVLHNHKKLMIDTNRIVIGGDSAGGALAANVANFIEEITGNRPVGQLLIYPFTDVRTDRESMREFPEGKHWSVSNNLKMIQYYLAGSAKNHLHFAIPMRNPLPEMIPQAYVEVAEMDCLRDEGIAYARRLQRNGADVCLREVDGAEHGYDIKVRSKKAQESMRERIKFLREVFESDPYQNRNANYSIPKKHRMKHHIFTGVDNLPDKKAQGEVIEGCLVLEGGAFRGVYGEGVLDALMENNIVMQTTIGVSAGAMNGMNYVSRQIGRAARVNLRYRFDGRYVGIPAMRENHGIIGFDFVYHALDETDPFDESAFMDPNRKFIAVATDVDTGEPVYFDRDTCSDIYKAVQASASMPYVSEPVELDGHFCLDGGCSVNTPYRWAVDQGYEKIVVVRTRNLEFRKDADDFTTRVLNPLIYRNKPRLEENLKNGANRYAKECEEMDALAKADRMFIIAPQGPLKISRLERDMEKLGDLYYQGYEDGLRALPSLKRYLGIED
ncbi:MAG: steryl acetyl hydrolase [Lachnospiraceae bacterium]|nr:steryl acetyl hydrolase [Lachnospiraceae bacterium]